MNDTMKKNVSRTLTGIMADEDKQIEFKLDTFNELTRDSKELKRVRKFRLSVVDSSGIGSFGFENSEEARTFLTRCLEQLDNHS